MIDDLSGSGAPEPITPREMRMYEQEYKHGAQLFQKALQQHTKSNNRSQQAEFQEVMDKAMRILNDTAAELNRKALLDQNVRIKKDYAAFNNAPTDNKIVGQLDRSLDQAKKAIS